MTTQLLGACPTGAFAPLGPNNHGHFIRRALSVAAVVALMSSAALTASAVTGEESTDTTTANVDVTTAIVLSGLTPTFTLTGIPGALVTGVGEVTMNVATNNLAGYAVTVQSTTDSLEATDVANTDEIPISALTVRQTGTTTWLPISVVGDTVLATTHTQGTRSAEGGDDLSNDYQVDIPFVNEDTYTATLNYIATTL